MSEKICLLMIIVMLSKGEEEFISTRIFFVVVVQKYNGAYVDKYTLITLPGISYLIFVAWNKDIVAGSS